MTEQEFLKTLPPEMPMSAKQAALDAWRTGQGIPTGQSANQAGIQTMNTAQTNVANTAQNTNIANAPMFSFLKDVNVPGSDRQFQGTNQDTTLMQRAIRQLYGGNDTDVFKRMQIARSKGANLYQGGRIGTANNKPVSLSYSEYNPFAKYQNLLKKKRGV